MDEWTPTADSIPKESGVYLCFFAPKPELLEEGVSLDFLESGLDRLAALCEFFADGDGGYFHHKMIYFKVTHWITIPDVPGERENEEREEDE